MRKIGLVIVGDGVLNGDFIDGASSNVAYALETLGYKISEIEITGNSAAQIQKGVENIANNKAVELIITVGALGVDLRGHSHRSGVARALGTDLAFFPSIKDHISQFSNRAALDAHAIQSQQSLGFETGATVPMFISFSEDPEIDIHVVSLSGWADLLDRQIQSLIANAIPPASHHEVDDYPLIFDSRKIQAGPQPKPTDEKAREKFAKIKEAISANDSFTATTDGVHIIFDSREYSPQKYAYLAAFLSAANVCVASAHVGDPNMLISNMPTGHAIVVLSDDKIDVFFQAEIQRVSGQTPQSLTDIDTTLLPKIFRATIKTDMDLDTLDESLRFDEQLATIGVTCYVSVPNLDDPTTGAVIEITAPSKSVLDSALDRIVGLSIAKNWNIAEPTIGKKTNNISTDGWDIPYSASTLMASPQKLLFPLPDSLSLRFHKLMIRQSDFRGTSEPQLVIDELVKTFVEQNTQGKYEFDVYEDSLGMLRPVALIAINEICVAYDIDLPELVSPTAFEKACELVGTTRPDQMALVGYADSAQNLYRER